MNRDKLYDDLSDEEKAKVDEIVNKMLGEDSSTKAYPSQYDVEAIWNTIDDSWRDKSEF